MICTTSQLCTCAIGVAARASEGVFGRACNLPSQFLGLPPFTPFPSFVPSSVWRPSSSPHPFPTCQGAPRGLVNYVCMVCVSNIALKTKGVIVTLSNLLHVHGAYSLPSFFFTRKNYLIYY